jgi:hypothetical protein
MASNKVNDYLKLSIIGAIIVIALSVAYYFVIFIPQRETQKIELQKEQLRIEQQKTDNKTSALKDCLDQAEVYARNFWTRTCKDYGVNNREADCNLPMYLSDNINAAKKNQQDQCYKLYR